jgi:ATP-dependent RNA helicase SUPV3L1/SUV3
LSFFRDHLVKSDKLFKASDMEDMMDLAWRADRRLGLDLGTRFAFAKTPLDSNDEDHVKTWESWMRSCEQGKPVRAPISPMAAKSSREEDKLWECERAMKLLSSYCWLSWRFEDIFPERAAAERARANLTETIEGMLARMGVAKAKAATGSSPKGSGRQAPGGARKGQPGRDGAKAGGAKRAAYR